MIKQIYNKIKKTYREAYEKGKEEAYKNKIAKEQKLKKELSKEEFIKYLNEKYPDIEFPIKLTEEEKKNIAEHIKNSSISRLPTFLQKLVNFIEKFSNK